MHSYRLLLLLLLLTTYVETSAAGLQLDAVSTEYAKSAGSRGAVPR